MLRPDTGSQLASVSIVGLNFWPETTGVSPYTTDLARALHEVGHKVHVVTAEPHYPNARLYKDTWNVHMDSNSEYPVSRVSVRMNAGRSRLRRTADEFLFGALACRRVGGESDVVVLVSPALFACAIVAIFLRLRRRRPKVLIWVQDLYGPGVSQIDARPAAIASLVSVTETMIIALADKIVVIHDAFRKHIVPALESRRRWRGRTTSDVHIVPNWVHSHALIPSDDEMFQWRSSVAGRAELVVLHAGNVGEKQDLVNLVRAALILDHDYPEKYRIVIIGDGVDLPRVKACATDLNVRNISFVPSLPEESYQTALSAADMLILNEKPGVTSAVVPSKLTSYFRAGRPIIAATENVSPAAIELNRSGAGLRVRPGDPLRLAESIVELSGDEGLRTVMGEHGRKYAADFLSRDGAVNTFFGIVQELAMDESVRSSERAGS